jgi:hypothetical protein
MLQQQQHMLQQQQEGGSPAGDDELGDYGDAEDDEQHDEAD